MDASTDLIEPLADRFSAFLYAELTLVFWQAQKLEAAMKLHQAQMKDVCYAIKAHYHWVNSDPFLFPEIRQCWYCGDIISPEFSLRRHKGLCALLEKREAAAARSDEYAFVDSWD